MVIIKIRAYSRGTGLFHFSMQEPNLLKGAIFMLYLKGINLSQIMILQESLQKLYHIFLF